MECGYLLWAIPYADVFCIQTESIRPAIVYPYLVLAADVAGYEVSGPAHMPNQPGDGIGFRSWLTEKLLVG